MAIRIITDSTSDFPFNSEQTLGIDIVPLSVLFGGEEFLDGVDLQKKEFYQKLECATELPTTSQINPGAFEKLFQKYINLGDEVVGIFLSSKLSGTYQSAEIAKSTVSQDKIFLIDSQSATFGLMLLVCHAVKMRDAGASARKIAEELTAMVPRQRFVALVQTLKYLKMGGRISASTALVGGILGIMPMVGIIDGEVKSIGKVKGRTAAYRKMLAQLNADAPDERYPLSFGHANSPALLKECMDVITKEHPSLETISGDIGCVIGTHSGPDCVGLAYIAKE